MNGRVTTVSLEGLIPEICFIPGKPILTEIIIFLATVMEGNFIEILSISIKKQHKEVEPERSSEWDQHGSDTDDGSRPEFTPPLLQSRGRLIHCWACHIRLKCLMRNLFIRYGWECTPYAQEMAVQNLSSLLRVYTPRNVNKLRWTRPVHAMAGRHSRWKSDYGHCV